MPLFTIPEARHFVQGYANAGGAATGSFRAMSQKLKEGKMFTEGANEFAEIRDCSLREVERLLFLAISQYRRSFNLLTPSTVSWAHVTLYYGAFYAASALLGLFGNWKVDKWRVIEVVNGTPGSQQLSVKKASFTHRGSHKAFWEFFYNATPDLLSWTDPILRYCLQPVSGDVTWLIDRRNEANYDTFEAHAAMAAFQKAFKRTKVIATLPGTLSTQLSVTEGLVHVLVEMVRQCKLETDALNSLQPAGRRNAKVRALILNERLPSLDRCIRRRALLG